MRPSECILSYVKIKTCNIARLFLWKNNGLGNIISYHGGGCWDWWHFVDQVQRKKEAGNMGGRAGKAAGRTKAERA